MKDSQRGLEEASAFELNAKVQTEKGLLCCRIKLGSVRIGQLHVFCLKKSPLRYKLCISILLIVSLVQIEIEKWNDAAGRRRRSEEVGKKQYKRSGLCTPVSKWCFFW